MSLSGLGRWLRGSLGCGRGSHSEHNRDQDKQGQGDRQPPGAEEGPHQGGDQDGNHHRDSSLLYVADTLSNRVAVIDRALTRTTSAGIGRTLSSGGSLNAPLGLVVTPSGTVLTVNGGDGFITEISPHGVQLAKMLIDNTGSPPGSGALFGLAFDPAAGVYFVDDASNTLNLLHH